MPPSSSSSPSPYVNTTTDLTNFPESSNLIIAIELSQELQGISAAEFLSQTINEIIFFSTIAEVMLDYSPDGFAMINVSDTIDISPKVASSALWLRSTAHSPNKTRNATTPLGFLLGRQRIGDSIQTIGLQLVYSMEIVVKNAVNSSVGVAVVDGAFGALTDSLADG